MQYVNFNQLRSFHAVAVENSFTGAARLLHVSQPTVTTQVRALEEEYGVELFYRRGRTIELTDMGRALFAITQRIFSLEEEALALLNASRELQSGHLKVGSVGPYFVMKLLAAFTRRYPSIRVSLTIGNSEEALQSLLDFRTDVVVLGDIADDPRLVALQYRRQPVVLFVNTEHPWSRRTGVRLRELDGQPLIYREPGSITRRALERALEAATVRPRPVMEVGREAVREAVAEGLGAGFMSEVEFLPDKKFRKLRILDADVHTDAYVVCLKERQESRLVRAFMDVASEAIGTRSRRGDGQARQDGRRG